MLPFASLGPLDRASHALVINGAAFLFSRLIREWRRTSLGLPGRLIGAKAPSGTLYAYSRHILPVPSDWGPDVLVSGYWFLDRKDWQPPESLAAFLDAGEPPIYFGFGSMPGLDPQRMTATVIKALARIGKRGILATGNGVLLANGAANNVHFITAAPHDRLLPRVRSVVHHGGAGTTAAALRAGKATTICPFLGDQPFWGRRVAELGVGPRPLDPRKLSADELAAAILAMEDPAMQERAAAIGAAIQSEDGVSAAVSFIGKTMGHPG